MYTAHGHWFAPAVPGEMVPQLTCLYGSLPDCPDCTRQVINFNIKTVTGASAQTFSEIPPVLNSPTPAAPSSPSGSPKLLAVPIDGLRDWYLRYLELKTAAKQIEDMLDEARSTLLDAVKSQFAELPAKTDFTIDGKPVLQRQVVVQKRVDTTRLKAERPDIHAQFVRPVEQERLNIL